MYGKLFDTLFKGSMCGAGAHVFAVWCYVIANMKPDQEHGAVIEFLNPSSLSGILGEEKEVIEQAIEYLCAPDPVSQHPAEQGRRLVKIGHFMYRVVSGKKYMEMRTADDRKEYFKIKQRQYRAKLREEKAARRQKKRPPGHSAPLAGEKAFLDMERAGQDVSCEPGQSIPLPVVEHPED